MWIIAYMNQVCSGCSIGDAICTAIDMHQHASVASAIRSIQSEAFSDEFQHEKTNSDEEKS